MECISLLLGEVGLRLEPRNATGGLPRIEVGGRPQYRILQFQGAQEHLAVEGIHIAPVHPYRAHDDIGLDSRPVVHRLGIGPDMERKVRCSDGVVGRVEKGARVDEQTGDGHRYQQCREDVPCSVSPISGQCASKRVGWWQQRGLGRPVDQVNPRVHVMLSRAERGEPDTEMERGPTL